MQRPTHLKSILITTTVLHVFEAGFSMIGGLFFTLGFSILFHDSPSMPYQFPWGFALKILALAIVIPVGFTTAQWVLFHKKRYRAALVTALIGILPVSFAFASLVFRALNVS